MASVGYRASLSNQIRTVSGGSNSPASGQGDTIDYITIAHLGNSKDFGNLSSTRDAGHAFASTTRGIFAGGASSPAIQFVTIMTTGDAVDFGSLSTGTVAGHGCSNATRGIMKMRGSSYVNTMEFLTIATLGNGVDTADLFLTRTSLGSTSSKTRACLLYTSDAADE